MPLACSITALCSTKSATAIDTRSPVATSDRDSVVTKRPGGDLVGQVHKMCLTGVESIDEDGRFGVTVRSVCIDSGNCARRRVGGESVRPATSGYGLGMLVRRPYPAIISAARSAMAWTVAAVFAEGIDGITDASATRRPLIP